MVMLCIALPSALAAVEIIPSSNNKELINNKTLNIGSWIACYYHLFLFVVSFISILIYQNENKIKWCIVFSIILFLGNIILFYYLKEYYYFMVGSLTLNIVYLVFVKKIIKERKLINDMDPFIKHDLDQNSSNIEN